MASIRHHNFLPLQVVRSQNSPTRGKPPNGSYSRRSFNLPNIIRRALLRTTITQRWEERLDFERGLDIHAIEQIKEVDKLIILILQ